MILVVDDHLDTRTVLVRLLRMDGYEAVAVENGEEALRYLQTHVPRLVFLDYSMPDMDGVSVVLKMKADARLAAVPILMFSAHEGMRREKALAAGVDAYVVKGTLDWAVIRQEILRLAGPGNPSACAPPSPNKLKTNEA